MSLAADKFVCSQLLANLGLCMQISKTLVPMLRHQSWHWPGCYVTLMACLLLQTFDVLPTVLKSNLSTVIFALFRIVPAELSAGAHAAPSEAGASLDVQA
jgi:hypothetical protein